MGTMHYVCQVSDSKSLSSSHTAGICVRSVTVNILLYKSAYKQYSTAILKGNQIDAFYKLSCSNMFIEEYYVDVMQR